MMPSVRSVGIRCYPSLKHLFRGQPSEQFLCKGAVLVGAVSVDHDNDLQAGRLLPPLSYFLLDTFKVIYLSRLLTLDEIASLEVRFVLALQVPQGVRPQDGDADFILRLVP